MLAAAVVTSSGTTGSCGAELGKQTPGAVLRFCSPQSHPIALPAGTLANKVKRKDTLAMKLGSTAAVQEEKFVFPRKSKEEWNEIRNQIGSTLTRYHKQRRVMCKPSVRPGGDWTKLVSCRSSLCCEGWNLLGEGGAADVPVSAHLP